MTRTVLPNSFISSSVPKLRDTYSTASKLYQLICNLASCHAQYCLTALSAIQYHKFVSSVLLMPRSIISSSVSMLRVKCSTALQALLYDSFVSRAVLPRSVISSSWWSMVHTMRFNAIIREMKFLNYNELLMVASRVGSWTHYSPVNVNDLVMDMSFGLSCTDILFFLWLGLII